MQNKNNKVLFGVLAAVVTSMVFMTSGGGIKTAFAQANPAIPSSNPASGNTSSTTSMSNMNMSTANTSNKTTVVRDSQTILLEGKTIPAKDFIHLYDSTPYMIMNGHIAMKLPCDANSVSPLKVLIGSAPNLKVVQPDLIKELSKPGSMCL